ncbi:hypothetical protein [Helicobacter acinonychis]|uniref:hypothetical protein n=1 Tax=Helicobacter acinonychis TaxID=212 RepID=UPI0005A15A2A|nr:hypothetical protein [Helicobacter acinonychis]
MYFLSGRVFSAIFSFILWVILCFPFIFTVVALIFNHSFGFVRSDLALGTFALGGLALQIVWFFFSFLLWVILTVWCCLVMHSDQRQEDIEQLINVINGIAKANSGNSLCQETQQTNTNQTNDNETEGTRIFISLVIFFLAIILLVIFFRKGEYQSSNNQRIDSKNPSHKHYNKNSNRSN